MQERVAGGAERRERGGRGWRGWGAVWGGGAQGRGRRDTQGRSLLVVPCADAVRRVGTLRLEKREARPQPEPGGRSVRTATPCISSSPAPCLHREGPHQATRPPGPMSAAQAPAACCLQPPIRSSALEAHCWGPGCTPSSVLPRPGLGDRHELGPSAWVYLAHGN